MTSIELLMQRAIDLAYNGLGSVSPNPLVGCVITKENQIVGEGWHKNYGGPHAEVNAVTSVADKQSLVGSTVIVNLEPCAHHGKTPPCADLLIQHRVGKVVIANVDTNPLVAGKGIARLRAAGIEVVTGVLETDGRKLNKRFFTMMERRRPYVILKWAQTSNGLIAGMKTDPRWISNVVSRQLVHRWRAEEDAILVGYKTALDDNPRLNVREWTGRNPVRVIIDKKLTLPRSLHVFDGTQRTLIFNTTNEQQKDGVEFMKLPDENFVDSMLSQLHKLGIQSILVEGGAATLHHFISSGLWDEARVFESTIEFREGLAAPKIEGIAQTTEDVAGDVLKVYYNRTAIPAPLK